MRVVLQKVKRASVTVDKSIVGEIQRGLVMLLGITGTDTAEDMKYILDKSIMLRIFEDENDKLNLSLIDVKGELLIVPNFTLYGDARKGRRPSYTDAAAPAVAEELFHQFVDMARGYDVKIAAGVFQAEMEVEIVNEGPVTLLLDSNRLI